MKKNLLIGAAVVIGLVGIGYGYGHRLAIKKIERKQGGAAENVSQKPLEKTPAKSQGKCSIFNQTVTPPKTSAEGAFTSAITDINAIRVISGGKLVGDSRFNYMWIKDEQRVPVYAPADGTLVKISYKTRVDLDPGMAAPDYDLFFLADCRTLYRLNHVTDPRPDIAAAKPVTEPIKLGKDLPAPTDKDTTPKTSISVKAGEQIGTTTGTPAAHNWDFGIFIDNSAVCPWEQFGEPIKSAWLALLGDTEKPIAGTACETSGGGL